MMASSISWRWFSAVLNVIRSFIGSQEVAAELVSYVKFTCASDKTNRGGILDDLEFVPELISNANAGKYADVVI